MQGRGKKYCGDFPRLKAERTSKLNQYFWARKDEADAQYRWNRICVYFMGCEPKAERRHAVKPIFVQNS